MSRQIVERKEAMPVGKFGIIAIGILIANNRTIAKAPYMIVASISRKVMTKALNAAYRRTRKIMPMKRIFRNCHKLWPLVVKKAAS